MDQHFISKDPNKNNPNQAPLEKNTLEQEHAATKHSYQEHTKKPKNDNHEHQDLLDPDHPQNNIA